MNGDIKTKIIGLNLEAIYVATPVPIDLPITITFYSPILEYYAVYLYKYSASFIIFSSVA